MPTKRHKPEEIVAKLRQVDVLTSQGESVADGDPPPLKWSALRYAFRQQGGRIDANEETQARRDCREAAAG
jgi:hypothetical protein